MKKIEKVSIAEISFTLDSDAYVSLKQYLDSLHDYYDKDPDGKEIIADIEARIAELILNDQVYTKIVGKQLIDSIISQLGTPEELREVDGNAGRGSYSADPSIPRRLYRSRDGRLLGGVCSGMSQFWNVNIAWLRIAFLAPLIMFILTVPFSRGSDASNLFLGLTWVFIVIYVVLWFAIPMAKSPRQKLEMRGEKITPSSIRQNLQEGASTPGSKKAASVLAEILAVIGRVVLFFIKFIVAVIGFSLVISALAICVAMIVALINPASIGMLAVMPLTGLAILPPILFVALILLCVMIPVFVVGAAMLSLVFSWKAGRAFYWILLGIWVLAMILLSVVTVGNARYLREEIRQNHNARFFGLNMRIDGDRWEHREIKANEVEFEEVLKEALEDGRKGFELSIARDSMVIVLKKDAAGAISKDTLRIDQEEAGKDRKTTRIVIRKQAE